MLSILRVRLTLKVKVGIPESFKVGWYPSKKTGSSHLKTSWKVACPSVTMGTWSCPFSCYSPVCSQAEKKKAITSDFCEG